MATPGMDRGDEAAFPRAGASYLDDNDVRRYSTPSRGLTVREWFAGMALQGILTTVGTALDVNRWAVRHVGVHCRPTRCLDAASPDSGEEIA